MTAMLEAGGLPEAHIVPIRLEARIRDLIHAIEFTVDAGVPMSDADRAVAASAIRDIRRLLDGASK